MSRAERAPIVGESVHYYEIRNGKTIGPLAAIVTNLPGGTWEVNVKGSVGFARTGEGALRFTFDVPLDGDGEYAGCFWKWPAEVRPVVQSCLF